MLTIATGNDGWRAEARYQHLAHRVDLAKICRNRHTPGRPWIAHTTDEIGQSHSGDAPGHIVGVRTVDAKAGLYSRWKHGTTQIDPTAEQDHEFYDYTTSDGRLELAAQTGQSRRRLWHQELLLKVLADEVNQPIPDYLKAAQEEGIADLRALIAKGSYLY